jgi:hypothetical protein
MAARLPPNRLKGAKPALVLLFAGLGGCALWAPSAVPTRGPTSLASSATTGPATPPSSPAIDGAFDTAPAEDSLVSVGPSTPFLSQGHGRGRFRTELRASDRAAFGSTERTLPAGFVVCAHHADPGGKDRLFCLRKRPDAPGGWEHLVSNGYGQPAIRFGQLADCAGCHTVAPRDGLFAAP